MSAGLVAVLVIAAVLLCVALGLVWWVNRPVSTDRAYARQTLPLFGNDVIIDEMIIDDEEDEWDEQPAKRDDNVAVARKVESPAAVADALTESASGNGEHRAHRFAPPLAPVRANGRQTVEAKHSSATTQTPPAIPTVRNDSLREDIGSGNTVSAGPTFEGKSLTFSVPTDGTLQFLPGRLEITAGKDRGREVRFVRVPAINVPRVTFGRVDGPMYRHVQLHDQTVSRKHAIMELSNGDWTLTNLSTTNPVVYNERLLGEGETQTLADGDRIEMGEVVFRYRVR